MSEEERKVKIKEEIVEGVFANFFRVNRKADEIVIDFCRETPESKEVEVKARIVTTLQGAKALTELLAGFVEEKKAPKVFEQRSSLYV